MVLPGGEMGRTAVTLLLEKIADPTRPLPPVALPAVYAPGDTCGPPLLLV
jgi:DNA-binding LacI/PurR family transcriptional regulator